MTPIPIAVVGVGSFGRNHARVLAAMPEAELAAVVDSNLERAEAAASEFNCRALSNHREIAGLVRAAVVAVPTTYHAEVGVELLQAGIDVLVEKPIAADLESAGSLISAAERHGRILQVGHLERFNPIVEKIHEIAELPLFFEVHRMSQFAPRSLDVDVILDLMIHDLDIVLSLVGSPLNRIEATGIPILSSNEDIASIRLVFENGCVANLTASRISVEKIRKLRFFQPRQYISIDYTRQDGAVFYVDANNKIGFRPLSVEKGEPLARQLKSFLHSVETRERPRVAGQDARRVLDLALRIKKEMERHSTIVAATIGSRQT